MPLWMRERRRWLSLYLFVTLSHGMHCDGHRGDGIAGCLYTETFFIGGSGGGNFIDEAPSDEPLSERQFPVLSTVAPT